MSADQRKKRLSSASVFGYSSREQHRAKKKHLSSSQFDLNWKLNSHTPLKWDDNEKRAVSKGEQVGISKRDLRPFKAAARYDNRVADVMAIPSDLFELNDLAEVLSHEVWLSILTEKERSQLTQFLPSCVDPDEVVQGLLAGENFHFGNPFLKWSSALCSGEIHPEAVHHSDESFRANKNAYYSELQKYHDNMIRNLQKLKDRCANANDPEKEIEQMTRRTREQSGKEVGYLNREQSVAADEKAWSSDNQSPLKPRALEMPKSRDSRKVKDEKQVGSSDVMKVASKSKKKDKFQKTNVNYGDGSKYMSYVKISKKQHEIVRNMKQSGNSIQSKALNCVIGNLSSFNVKPYVMFEEEEQRRIGEYWSNLAKKDIPSSFSKWGSIQSERGEIMKSLCLEIEENLKHLMEEDEMDHSNGTHCYEEGSVISDDTEQTQEDEVPVDESADDQDSDPSSANEQSPMQMSCLDVKQFAEEQAPLQMPSLDGNQFTEEQAPLQMPSLDGNQFTEEQAPLQMPSLDVNHKCSPMDLNEKDNHISPKSNEVGSLNSDEASEESHSTSESLEKSSCLASVVNGEAPQSSARDAWPATTMVGSAFCSSSMDYASCSGIPLNHPEAIEDQTAQLMDLESGIPDEIPSKNLLPQQSDQLPFFGSYQNNERQDLLHTIIKRDSYHEQPKKTMLGFHPRSNLLIDHSQFPGHHSQDPSQLHPAFPLELRHRAPPSDFFLHPNIPENMYPDSNRFSMPRPDQFTALNMRARPEQFTPVNIRARPEQFTPMNMREWNTAPRFSAPPMHAPLTSSMDLLNHNWFPVENRAQPGWSGPEVYPNPNLASGSGGGDQSLFSVLTQCNNLHPATPAFGAMVPHDKFMPTGNFAEDLCIGIPRSNPLPHPAAVSPLDYLNGHDIAPPNLKTSDMGWMNMPHQSSSLHDPTGKPFPKPWNQ
ncbi:hypothetical protein V2J09_011503 [Rumex salicifolius]